MASDSSPSRSRRWLRALTRVLVGGYLLFSLLFGAAFTFKQALRRTGRPVLSAPSDLAARAALVEFVTEDDYRIRGLLADPVGDAPVLIVQHGRGANRDDVLPWSQVFARAGYGVLSFDWRGHGDSDGNIIQHGGGEPNDLAAALAFLDSRPATKGRPIGLVGFSLGAACLAMSAPRLPPRVRCMVLDSPYGDLERMVARRLAPLGPARLGPTLVLQAVAWSLFGAVPSAIRPQENLKAFTPRPVFWMHGGKDRVIPLSEGRSLALAYPGPLTAWETPETAHCESRITQTREWVRRVAAFLAEHLASAPSALEVLKSTPEKLERGHLVYGARRKGGT